MCEKAVEVALHQSVEDAVLDNAKVEDIEAATRKLLRAGEKDASAKVSPVVKVVAAQLKSKPLQGVTVRVTGGKLFLGAILLGSLAELSAALLRIDDA